MIGKRYFRNSGRDRNRQESIPYLRNPELIFAVIRFPSFVKRNCDQKRSFNFLHGNLDQLAEGEDPEQVAMELCVMAKGIIFSWANERGDFDIDQIAEHMFGAYIRSVIRH